MALLTCPDCGGKVSDKASACPRCGKPVANILSELRATSSSAAVPPPIPAVPPVPVQEQPEAVQAPQVPARQDDAPPAQVPQTKKGGNALLWIILGFLLLAAAGAAAFFVVKGLKSKAAAADTSWLYGQWYGTINGSNYCYAFSPYGECHVTVYKPYEFDYGKDARANLCEEYSYLHGLSPKSGKYSIEEGQVVLDVPGGGIADRLSIMTADGEKALSFDGSTYALLRKVSSVGEAMSVEDLLEMSGKDWDPDESLESLLEKAGLTVDEEVEEEDADEITETSVADETEAGQAAPVPRDIQSKEVDEAAETKVQEGEVRGDESDDDEPIPYQIVEQKPLFNGGDANEIS